MNPSTRISGIQAAEDGGELDAMLKRNPPVCK